MIIDNNEKQRRSIDYHKAGDNVTAHRIQDEFLAEFDEFCKENDHCSCQEACKLHGNCRDCVAVHRGHRDHLPNCFHSMVNERLRGISELTHHTAVDADPVKV